MLIKTDYTNKRSSTFCCDRCKVRILNKERKLLRIYEPSTGFILKKWDLCPVCYRKLYRGIEKYSKKTE